MASVPSWPDSCGRFWPDLVQRSYVTRRRAVNELKALAAVIVGAGLVTDLDE
jgi:hypothetical protein